MIRRLSREFLEFVQRGNVVDLAVAVIIGAAFTKIVNAVVELITTEALKPSMQELGISHLDQWPAGLVIAALLNFIVCLLYTSPSPRDQRGSRMPSSA